MAGRLKTDPRRTRFDLLSADVGVDKAGWRGDIEIIYNSIFVYATVSF